MTVENSKISLGKRPSDNSVTEISSFEHFDLIPKQEDTSIDWHSNHNFPIYEPPNKSFKSTKTSKLLSCFSCKDREVIQRIIKIDTFHKHENPTLNRLEKNNFLRSFWVSLNLFGPAMRLTRDDKTFCKACLQKIYFRIYEKFGITPDSKNFSKKETKEDSSDLSFLSKVSKLSKSRFKFIQGPFFFRNLEQVISIKDTQFKPNKSDIESKLKESWTRINCKLKEVFLLKQKETSFKNKVNIGKSFSKGFDRPIFNLEIKTDSQTVLPSPVLLSPIMTPSIGKYNKRSQNQNFNVPNTYVSQSICKLHQNISNLEQRQTKKPISEIKKNLQSEKTRLNKLIHKDKLHLCKNCYGQVKLRNKQINENVSESLSEIEQKKPTSQNLIIDPVIFQTKIYKNYSKSLYDNVGLCIELEKRYLLSSLLKLETKLIAESISEIKAITEYGKILVEFKDSHLIFPFSMKDILYLDSIRAKSLFQFHKDPQNKVYSFNSAFNQILIKKPQNINFASKHFIFKTLVSEPLLRKGQEQKNNDPFTSPESQFARFCLNSRNYSQSVEERVTLQFSKQTRKTKVKQYKDISRMVQHLPKQTSVINKMIFNCHHCSKRGPRKDFLECFQKHFYSKLLPEEELLKVFLNLNHNLSLYCKKMFCKDCVKNFYPKQNVEDDNINNWICIY